LAATTDFGLRRQAERHAALGSNRQHGKRCRRCAPVFAALRLGRLPPQSKSLSSVREVAGLYYGFNRKERKDQKARLSLSTKGNEGNKELKQPSVFRLFRLLLSFSLSCRKKAQK
jgi:hypothetical protein